VYVYIYKEGERELITYLITGRERAYILAIQASKAGGTIVVQLLKVTNILALTLVA
jgi:hypothetical protein